LANVTTPTKPLVKQLFKLSFQQKIKQTHKIHQQKNL